MKSKLVAGLMFVLFLGMAARQAEAQADNSEICRSIERKLLAVQVRIVDRRLVLLERGEDPDVDSILLMLITERETLEYSWALRCKFDRVGINLN